MACTRLEVMVTRGIVPTTRAALVLLHPDLFKNEGDAHHWLHRELGANPLYETPYKEMALSSVRLQTPGRGSRAFEVLVRDPATAEALAERLGARLLGVSEPAPVLAEKLSEAHIHIFEAGGPVSAPPPGTRTRPGETRGSSPSPALSTPPGGRGH
jgi:hypothetical protein